MKHADNDRSRRLLMIAIVIVLAVLSFAGNFGPLSQWFLH